MSPSLRITADVAPVVATIEQLARAHNLTLATGIEAEWHLHLSTTGPITLTAAGTVLASLPIPAHLSHINSALADALHQWQHRPLPLGNGWELSTTRRCCLHPHHPAIDLTDKETALLAALIHAHGQPLERDTLLTQIWAYESGIDSHTLETHIYRLRGKCEQLTGLQLEIRADSAGYTLLALI